MKESFPKVLIISGPTASGKSYLAELFYQSNSLIINADSKQIYKELPILTAQPDIKKHPNRYSLYSILNYHEKTSVGKWYKLAHDIIIQSINDEGIDRVIIVGGTGFYLQSLIEGCIDIPETSRLIKKKIYDQFSSIGKSEFYKALVHVDPSVAQRINAQDSYRMMRAMEVYTQTGRSITSFGRSTHRLLQDAEYEHICLMPDRDFLYDCCNKRFDEMIDNGAIDEVKALKDLLLQRGESSDALDDIGPANAIGFKEISDYLDGKVDMQYAKERSQQLTRNYAKRQLTWFRNKLPNKQTFSYSSATEFAVLCEKLI